ncbi:MAG: CatA-like O-acetyltransferase [Methanobrevibacter ruminantium]|uniref:CatA-like O-acetyltransferase n=1 Tax=Methanobrevibacter ruminantium TaxID=83816 RepID=UPI002D810955|nr:CatA-like O-acetyltransferase [Methanobrevibacter ruminantium]MCI5737000.1 CatA-like O-acetyltransferase [Methanobrevibacter ruminantium]
MKEIDFDLENNPFINFLSSRYSMSARIDVENLWIKSKEQDLSFFVMSLGALMNALNDIPQMRRRIIDGKVIEFESLDAVCPIMDKEETVFKEIRIEGPQRFYNILKWHDYVVDYQLNVLGGVDKAFDVDTMERDKINIANFSCIPWVDFDSITNATAEGNAIQPLITWGKVNENYGMTVSITVSHIFVNGLELAKFYKNVQENFDSLL